VNILVEHVLSFPAFEDIQMSVRSYGKVEICRKHHTAYLHRPIDLFLFLFLRWIYRKKTICQDQ